MKRAGGIAVAVIVAAILVLAVIGRLSTDEDDGVTPTAVPTATIEPTVTAVVSELPTATAVPVEPTATIEVVLATEEPESVECLTPPPLVKPPNLRPAITVKQGQAVVLDADRYLEGVGESAGYRWEQVFAAGDSLDYTSHNLARLDNAGSSRATFVTEWPGNYRFRVTATEGGVEAAQAEMEVGVLRSGGSRYEFKAVNFPDLFGNNGGAAFDISPDDPECRAQAIEHALEVVPRINAEWIVIVPANFATRLDPSPVWGAQYEELSLLDDEFYGDLIDAAHARGLKVVQAEQDAPDFSIGEAEYARWNDVRATGEYWKGWFDEWEPWVIERAARAEAFGVDMIIPFVWASDTFRPELYPEYGERWREITSEIREVFSGQVGTWVSLSADQRLNYLDAVDAVVISVDSTYFSNDRMMADPQRPTVEEMIAGAQDLLSISRQTLADAGVPVYYGFGANSANGQRTSEDVEELATFVPDFQEQVVYFEAMFRLLEAEPWVTGMMVGAADWFDQFERPQEEIYFDQTFQGSFRSKPAEDAIGYWLGAGAQ